jgi:hypothetical protein
MANAPEKLTIRTYHVGFGDCFLLSFKYANSERHVLVDYGSTGVPKPIVLNKRMKDIALDIQKRTNGKLHAVVATHRHKDHISGFETKKDKKGTGDIIRSLKPNLVVQPWTEDPKLGTKATGPKPDPRGKHIAALGLMQNVAAQTLLASRATRYFDKELKSQLSFLGESNINNPSAVKNLMDMAPNDYVHCGKKTKLETQLPGVKIHVLGPPTVEQTETIKKERSKDPDEFWHFQANTMQLRAANGSASKQVLFPKYVRSPGPTFPIDARWLIFHSRMSRGNQLLEIVRMLDKAMNNTSVILVFQIGKKCLLFPGDAQIENWQYALGQKKYQALLSRVNLYKVGHHGSLNATPKSLWKMFQNKSADAHSASRLNSLMSTMEHKHGREQSHTEVPRKTLVSQLRSQSNLFSTQDLKGGELFHDSVLTFTRSKETAGSPRRRPRRAAR